MPKTKGSFDDDVLLLSPGDHGRKFDKFPQPHFEAPIIKGVASQLRRWPTDLFLAYLAACFIIGSLVFLIFVTVAFCLPAAIDNRVIESFPFADSPNVYFLKLENRTWSTREFCSIETAARKHPDINVYLINLLKHEPEELKNEDIRNKTEGKINATQSILNMNSSAKLTPEQQLKKRLVSGSPNIQSIDISVERFFKSSKLLEIVKILNDGLLELAAKTQLLWNSPGIVLNPDMFCNLESIEQFLCNRNKENCLPDKLATIEPKNDIQATEVPCQAFVGFLMREIWKNRADQEYTIKKALEQYCQGSYYCPEVRVLDLKSKCMSSELNCPIIYSSKIL